MRKLFDFFRQNIKAILTSFFLAFLLWLVITTNKEYKTRVVLPFSISRLAENKVLLNPVPDKIILEVSGKGRALLALKFYSTRIDLELPEIEKSTTIDLTDYLNRFDVARELGVSISSIIEPKKIDLRVDHYAEAYKPVRVQSHIEAAPGYIVMEVKPLQDTVKVSGPHTLIERLNYVETQPVHKKEVKYPFRETMPLLDPRPGIIRIFPEKVLIDFKIEQIVERTIFNVPIQIVGVPANLQATPVPPNVSLRVKGGESLITALSADAITVYFDYSKHFESGTMNYSLQIETPPNVTWTHVSPDNFRLQLKRTEVD